MRNKYDSMTVTGYVESVFPAEGKMILRLLSGDELEVWVSRTTRYEILRNIGAESRDRVAEPNDTDTAIIGEKKYSQDKEMWEAKRNLLKYIKMGAMVAIRGVSSENGGPVSYSARRVVLMDSEADNFGWERTHWWLQQINTLFGQWLDVLFNNKREITENDFAEFYRTHLDLLGGRTADDTQECATMSRLLYGLSSSYLLTGNDRAFSAAKACAVYMINAFSILSHDRMYCFWKFGLKQDGKSTRSIMSSQNPDDKGTYALYEQIYALAGLTQYYRITQDTRILSYITRTISAFEKFFRDKRREGDDCFTGKGGYFTHIDPVTMRPDADVLGNNRMRKNWNSIGDHIPAYLVNLLLAIDPLPRSLGNLESWNMLQDLCRDILDDCIDNILEHFPPKDKSLFVNERFLADWTPDHNWSWQQNRGIVGHNLKISWNLTRCAHYYYYMQEKARLDRNNILQQACKFRADRCYELARLLGDNMADVGVDLVRGGVFDAVERDPSNGMPTEFSWETTKDFWQQEQAILAYYIMSGIEKAGPEHDRYLDLARYCAAFWNLYFVDQENRKIYLRTTESGAPVVQDGFGVQAGHSIAGYHSFELNYLAHIYIRSYVNQATGGDYTFCITFRPCKNVLQSLNVLPDFFRPGDLKIIGVKLDGLPQEGFDEHCFQINIGGLKDGAEVEVEFLALRGSAVDENTIEFERSDIKDLNFG